MRPLPLCLLLLTAAAVCAQETPLPTLTTAREIRALPPEEAARPHPVQLRAVVTLVASEGTIFIQDATGGTYLHVQKTGFTAKEGQELEITGTPYRGLYLTGIIPSASRLLGIAPLPPARPVTFEELGSGRFNYERVEVRGTVRAFRSEESGRGVLTLGVDGGRLEIIANHAEPAEAARLIDAAVRVPGLAAGFINNKRQLVSPHLRIAGLDAVIIEQAAPEDPFALPATPAASLLQFGSGAAPGHRVKVTGVVTHHEPGRALFLRDGEQGLVVQGSDAEVRQPGDIVEVAGFAEMGAFSAELHDAIWRVRENGPPPAVLPTTSAEILRGAHDADLVQLDAELVDAQSTAEETTLLLRSGEVPFRARLSKAGDHYADHLRPGSGLRLTGIVIAEQVDFATQRFGAKPRSFTLLLRSPADLMVLHQPPWWTPRRLAAVLGACLLLAGAALAWAGSLRRRVAAQTAIIREKVTAEAATAERERIAREFHDTLEQELVGLSLRLDAATSKVAEPKPRELLESARGLVQSIQTEARNLVRNLRARASADAPLPETIDRALEGLRHERTIEVHTEGESRRLDGVVEHELLRIAQEASTNAVKHGRAERIDITLGFAPAEIRLVVKDNGHGFDPASAGSKPGHFGLVGMRERVQKLGGMVSIESRIGGGTTVSATVPLGSADEAVK